MRSTSVFCSASRRAFCSSSSFVFCSSSCWDCSSCARDCDCLRSDSVVMFASMVFRTIPIDSVSWSRKSWWMVEKRSKLASSMTACTCPSKRTGRTMMLIGADSPRAELIFT